MSRTKLLLNLITDLNNLSETIKEIAEVLESNEDASVKKKPTSAKKKKVKTVTLEEVRAVLADKSQDGLTAQVRELLKKHGAAKLSEIDPTKYSVLLKEAEELK